MASFATGLHTNQGPSRYVYWKFYWAGWESTGHALQRAGWQFSSIRSERTFSDMIYIEMPGIASFMSAAVDDMASRVRHDTYDMCLPVNLRHVAREVIINSHSPPTMEPLDMSPISEHEWQRIRLTEHSPFKRLLAPEKQRIIIPPSDPSVEEMLDRIIKMQQPAQVEYFNNKVKENRMPEATITAQIIQFKAAA